MSVTEVNEVGKVGILTCAWLAGQEHCSASYLALPHHAEYNPCGSPCRQLTHHALRHLTNSNPHSEENFHPEQIISP